jgi:D-psicose/D-tagatose/L-ribulose 3-epimerase
LNYGLSLLLWADEMHDGLMPVLQLIQRMGYDGVEVPMFDLAESSWTPWARRLDDLGLARTAVHTVSVEHNPVSADPLVRQRAYEHMQAVIDCCAAVGASVLAGPHQIALGAFGERGHIEDEWKRSVEHIRRVAAYAASAGVALVEEVLNRFEQYLVTTVGEGIRFVDEVAHPNCRIHLDTFHSHIEEKHTADAIRLAGSRIGYVHVSENDRGIPGTGQVAWTPIFDALHDIGYDGWLTIESFTRTLPRAAGTAKIWRPLFESQLEVATNGLAFMKAQVASRGPLPA